MPRVDLRFECRTKPLSKVLGISINEYLVDQEFEVEYTILNNGTYEFEGGNISIEVNWGDDIVEGHVIEIPKLKSNQIRKAKKIHKIILSVASEGPALFRLKNFISVSGLNYVIKQLNTGEKITADRAFHVIICKNSSEIHEYWALVIAATSLAIIALEKIWLFLVWLKSLVF